MRHTQKYTVVFSSFQNQIKSELLLRDCVVKLEHCDTLGTSALSF